MKDKIVKGYNLQRIINKTFWTKRKGIVKNDLILKHSDDDNIFFLLIKWLR